MTNVIEPGDNVHSKNYGTKLDDVWWDVRGPGQVIDRVDSYGKVVGTTTVNTEMTWNSANFARVNANIAALSELVRQLAVKQGVTIDYTAIAKAVVDEEGKRLTGVTDPMKVAQ